MPVHSDFIAAFTPGHIFASPYGKLRVRQRQVGKLVVPSGQIIAVDPSCIQNKPNQVPFEKRIEPGQYPVIVSLARLGENECPACLKLQITKTVPVKWELALCRGEKLAKLKPGQFYGYGVDAGLGCFVDAEAALAVLKHSNWFKDIFQGQLLPALKSGKTFLDWAEITLNPETGANLIACTSGVGDGSYASFWGLDRNGKSACLVTDFGILIPNEDDED